MKTTAERIENHYGVAIPHRDAVVYTDDVRGWVADMMADLSRRVRAGELDGARSEWRRARDDESPTAFVMVELYGACAFSGEPKAAAAVLTRVEFKPESERPGPRAVKGG